MSDVVGDLVRDAALLVTLAALVSAALALAATRKPTVALPVLLDLLLAASLLRLTLRPGPAQLAGTALLVLVKRLVSAGIRRAAAVRAGGGPGGGTGTGPGGGAGRRPGAGRDAGPGRAAI